MPDCSDLSGRLEESEGCRRLGEGGMMQGTPWPRPVLRLPAMLQRPGLESELSGAMAIGSPAGSFDSSLNNFFTKV